jgi:hypothetical protein
MANNISGIKFVRNFYKKIWKEDIASERTVDGGEKD